MMRKAARLNSAWAFLLLSWSNSPPGEPGITIDGEPPIITSITRTSPLRDILRIGLAVDSIALEDGMEYKGYAADEIRTIMEDNREDTIMMGLKNPACSHLTKHKGHHAAEV
jgi:hypothetical protein